MALKVIRNENKTIQKKQGLDFINCDSSLKISNRAKKIYKILFEVLNRHKRIEETDIITISLFAQNMDTYAIANEIIHEKEKIKNGSGYIQTFKSGASNFSPEYLLRSNAEKQILVYIKKLGLSLRDRKEITSMIQDDKQLSLLDQLFANG